MTSDDLTFNAQNFQGNTYTPNQRSDEQDYLELNKERGLAQSMIDQEIAAMEAETAKRNQETMSGMTIMPDGMNHNPEGNFAEHNGYYNLLADVESKGNYNAKNKSGAYGKYQFMPSTEKAYAAKLGMTIKQARTPEGQETMVRRFTKDNIDGLIRNNIPVTKETLWWAHNQGLQGAINLYKGGNVSSKNLQANGGKNSAEYIAKWRKIFGNRATPRTQGLASS